MFKNTPFEEQRDLGAIFFVGLLVGETDSCGEHKDFSNWKDGLPKGKEPTITNQSGGFFA